MTKVRRHSRDLAALAALLLIPLCLLWSVSLGDRTLIPADNLFQWNPWRSHAAEFGVEVPHNDLVSDLLLENYAWKRFILQCIQNREIPLWNPYLFAGTPFAATGQHSIFYPFSLVFYLLPLARAYGLFTVSQIFLAGAFTYLFARVLGMRRSGALMAAVVYQLCGYTMVSITFPMILAASAWLPFVLAMIELVVRRQPVLGGRPASFPWAALGAMGLGMQLLAGHGENSYFVMLVMAMYAAWRLVCLCRAPARTQTLRQRLRCGAQPALWVAVMMAVGLGLGSIQLIPFVEVVQHNFRAGAASLADVLSWSYPYRQLIAFVAPNFFGNPSYHSYLDLFSWQVQPVVYNALGDPITKIDWGMKNYVEGGAYLGILPLLLTFTALVRSFRRGAFAGRASVWFFGLLGLLSLSFIFPTGAYAIIHAIPVINQSHSPFRWVFPLSLSVAVLAGWGMGSVTVRASRVVTTWLARLAVLGGLGGVVGLTLARLFYGRIEALVDRAFRSLARAPEAFPDVRAFFSYELIQLLIASVTLMAAGLLLMAALRRLRWWPVLAVLLVALDLAVASWSFAPAADPALLSLENELVRFLETVPGQPGSWRLTTFTPHGDQPLHANTPWLYNLQDVRGYDSIIAKQYVDYMAAIEPQEELLYNRIQPIKQWQSLNSPLLDLLNVKYIVTAETIDLPKLSLVWEGEGLRVYENLAVAPRAFVLPVTATVRADVPLQAMADYDPRYFVVGNWGEAEVERWGLTRPPVPASPVPATILDYGSQQVTVELQTDQRSWLVLADSFFPGWKAFAQPKSCLDCEETQLDIVLVDGNFRGMVVEPGAWTIRMRYSPMTFKLGLFGSFMAAVVIIFAATVWLWRSVYQTGAADSAIRTLAKNSLAPMGINVLNRMIDFAFAALSLRILGVENAGKYYVAINIASWFEILGNFGLHTLLTREVAKDRGAANRYLINTTVLRFLTSAGAAIPIALYVLVLGFSANPLAGDTTLAIVLLAVGMLPSGINTGLTGLFYVYEKAEIPAVLATVSTILKVTLGTAVLLAGAGFVGLAAVSIGVSLVNTILLGAIAFRLFFVPHREVDWRLQRGMLGESFPLMLNHLLATLFFKVNVLLIERLGGTQKISGNTVVGWYSTAFKWVDAVNLVPSLFTAAIFPLISRQARESRQAMRETYQLAVKLLVIIALPLAVVTTCTARFLVQVLGGAEFLPHGAIALQILIWSIPIGWINSITNYVLIALDQQRMLTRAFLLGVGFNVVANYLFIPHYGYPAAATIAILSELVLWIAFYQYLRSSLAPVPWFALLWRPVVSACAMALATWAGWSVHWALGLTAAGLVYPFTLAVLGTFGPAEQRLLADLMPRRLRGLCNVHPQGSCGPKAVR